MSRVITFSRYFPKGHPRQGEPTYFVEKIWTALMAMDIDILDHVAIVEKILGRSHEDKTIFSQGDYIPKIHTIRAGDRWEVGDKFSPRVWTGKPYCSKQLAIAPDLEITATLSVEIVNSDGMSEYDGVFGCGPNGLIMFYRLSKYRHLPQMTAYRLTILKGGLGNHSLMGRYCTIPTH